MKRLSLSRNAMNIRRLVVPLLFCFSVWSTAAKADELPDNVEVRFTKKGAAPASIAVDIAGEKTTLKEGEWDKLPPEARAYVEKMFAPQKLRTITISLDVSKAPEAGKWGENAIKEAERMASSLIDMLDSEGFVPPTTAKIVFKKMDGVAYTSNDEITISVDWITQHPDDIGMVIHELTHVIQAYRAPVPGWVTEGIADYLRFFVYEKNGETTCRVNPNRAKHTDGYRTTGAFFDWIVRTQDKDFIKKLNAECRNGKYSDDLFKDLTGKPLDELWTNFIESLKQDKK